jgi:hypothetical protein
MCYIITRLSLLYLHTLLEFWTIIGTVQIQLIHQTYQLRVLDYYKCDTEITAEEKEVGGSVMMCKARGCETVWVHTTLKFSCRD